MIEIFDCEQNSPEWLQCRMGIPTASEFKTLLGIKKEARDKATRRTYMLKLAGEIISGEPMESYSNASMERGHEMENDAREFYCFTRNVEAQRVGFIRNGNMGVSPDSLIGEPGMLEIKTKFPHILIELLLKDDFPPEHKAQCQGALMVAEREWIDIICYWPGVPKLVKRAFRDEPYIAELRTAVSEFNAELAEIVAKIRAYGSEALAA
jgi:hypothetical protein